MYNRYIRNDNGYMTGCPSRRRPRRPVPNPGHSRRPRRPGRGLLRPGRNRLLPRLRPRSGSF